MAYVATDVKLVNRKTVFQLLCRNGAISRTEISQLSKISPPTVMKIMHYFENIGLVKSVGEDDTALGRKRQLYMVQESFRYAVGVLLEGAYLKLGIVNLLGRIVCMQSITCAPVLDQDMVQKIILSVEQMLEENQILFSSVAGIGVGIPGIYDIQNHMILTAPLMGILKPTKADFVINALQEHFGSLVYLENDVNLEALGEFHARGMTGGDLLYISLGTGVGAGIMIDGKLRSDGNYFAGEIGYMTYDAHYIAGKNQPGWLESRINLQKLKEKFSWEINSTTQTNMEPMMDYITDYIALCIANIAGFLGITHIALGGVVFDTLGEQLVERIRSKLKRLSIFDFDVTLHQSPAPGIIGGTLTPLHTSIDAVLEQENP